MITKQPHVVNKVLSMFFPEIVIGLFSRILYCIFQINSSASLKRVCLLGCGIATGYGAVLNTGIRRTYGH